MEQNIWQQKWVIGNWKMNGQLHDNNSLVHKLRQFPAADRVCIGISPPAVYLSQVHNAVPKTSAAFPTKAHTRAKSPPK